MGIFGWNGAEGLPPLRDDENLRSRRCEWERCTRPAVMQTRFCAQHFVPQLYKVALEGESACERPATAADYDELAACELSAPLFAYASARDFHDDPDAYMIGLEPECGMCRAIITEHDDAAYADRSQGHSRFRCARHRERQRVWWQTITEFSRLRAQKGMSSAEIAERFKYGYLGERLTDDRPFP